MKGGDLYFKEQNWTLKTIITYCEVILSPLKIFLKDAYTTHKISKAGEGAVKNTAV